MRLNVEVKVRQAGGVVACILLVASWASLMDFLSWVLELETKHYPAWPWAVHTNLYQDLKEWVDTGFFSFRFSGKEQHSSSNLW
jgi:hypothetical protein